MTTALIASLLLFGQTGAPTVGPRAGSLVIDGGRPTIRRPSAGSWSWRAALTPSSS